MKFLSAEGKKNIDVGDTVGTEIETPVGLICLLVGWIGSLTSHSTIFQLYMWRRIDMQAAWRRQLTYGRAPNAIDISKGSLKCPSNNDTG